MKILKEIKFVLCLLVLHASICCYAQVDCTQYQQMELEGIEESWVHFVRDSTIIGHEVPDFRFDSIYLDPFRKNLSAFHYPLKLVTEEHLYSFIPSRYDADDSGHLIEKIDLETGALVWQRSTDLRWAPTREKIFKVELKEDTLVTYGLSCPYPDSLMSFWTFQNSFVKSIFFERGHDVTTGDELYYNSTTLEDSMAFLVSSEVQRTNDRHVMVGDTLYFFEWFKWTDGAFVTLDKVDKFGRADGVMDTVIRSDFNHLKSDFAFFTLRANWSKIRHRPSDGHFLYADVFIPVDSSIHEPMAHLREFDASFNELSSLNINEVFPDEFINVNVIEFTDDHILLSVQESLVGLDVNSFDDMRNYFIIMDRDYNLMEIAEFVNDVDPNDDYKTGWNDSYLSSGLSPDGKIHLSLQREFGDQYLLEFYESNGSGTGVFNLKKVSRVETPDWLPRVFDFELLPNGDHLYLMGPKCIDVNKTIQNHSFYEWWRIPADQISDLQEQEVDLTQDGLKVYPNPTNGQVDLSLEKALIQDIEVYSIAGRLIYKDHRDAISNQVGLDNLSWTSGLYIIVVRDDEGKLYRTKLVVE